MDNYTVSNNEELKQFEVELNGEKAYLTYNFHKGDIALIHTFVPKALEGKGIASALAQAGFKYAKEHQMPVIVYCPFVASYLKRHPEYDKLVDKKYTES